MWVAACRHAYGLFAWVETIGEGERSWLRITPRRRVSRTRVRKEAARTLIRRPPSQPTPCAAQRRATNLGPAAQARTEAIRSARFKPAVKPASRPASRD